MGKIRAVDDDQNIRRSLQHRVGRLSETAQDHRQFFRDRGKADDRQLLDGKQRHQPFKRHGRAADALEGDIVAEPQLMIEAADTAGLFVTGLPR